MRASAPTYDSSSATASGACLAMSAATASWIVFKRRTVFCSAGVDQQPCATSLRRPPLSWTTPYPQAAVPGSMPTTFTTESYGPDRTNPVSSRDRMCNSSDAAGARARGRSPMRAWALLTPAGEFEGVVVRGQLDRVATVDVDGVDVEWVGGGTGGDGEAGAVG